MDKDIEVVGETAGEAGGKQVIARAAAVLRTLEGQGQGLTVAEMTRASELPRTTVLRIVTALQAQQMVVSLDGRIRLGPALTRLAGSTFLDVVGIARPHIEALARATRETVNLSVLRGNHAVLVDQVASDRELRVVTPVGSALPLYCTAHGKALLADMTDEEVRERLNDVWECRTALTITGIPDLLKELATIRSTGTAYDSGENIEGVNGIGITVTTSMPERYALSIAMPAVRFIGRETALAKQIQSTAMAISACF